MERFPLKVSLEKGLPLPFPFQREMGMTENKYLVMVVEDDVDSYTILQEALKQNCPNADHRWAKDGEEALDYLSDQKNHRPSVIFLDLNMPKIDGWECLEKIRTSEKLKHIPVIILTNSNNPADVTRAYRSGANNFVTKPSSYKELARFLQTFHAYWFEFSQLPIIF